MVVVLVEEAPVEVGKMKAESASALSASPLNASELKHLAGVIEELEHKTSGEIRLMIVRRSTIHSLFSMLFGWVLCLGLLIMWIERHQLIWLAHWWWLPLMAVGSALLAWILSRSAFVLRMAVPAGELSAQVVRRAELEFYHEGLRETQDRTGILLFISLAEHQAVVLADEGIAKKLKPDVWNGVVATLIEGARSGRWCENLEKALRDCGGYLATHFPHGATNRNELSNTVIVKD